ncbi:MAG TPA: diaminopimelate epimerase [Coriobacteriia bacterium]
MEFRFTKMHGLGNDFVVVDDRNGVWDFDEGAVSWICDRHFGVGADGLIVVRAATTPDADWAWEYRNADGSFAEMCGNGIRCVARWLTDRGLADGGKLRMQSPGGVNEVEIVLGADGEFAGARVDMGEPVLSAADVPVDLGTEPVIDHLLHTDAGDARVTALSMGNPHAVIWVDDVDEAPVDTLGPAIENHPAFPRRTNVEFAHADSEDHIRLRVWERGVGETLACGTGACAAMVAACLSCRTGRKATVELPGGELVIEWPVGGHVSMTGPAEQVFEGVMELANEE